MKKVFLTMRNRWKAKVPVFFKWVMGFGASLASVALAIQMALNSAGASVPGWWESLYPYLIGMGAGMTACGKFTQVPPPEEEQKSQP